MQKDIDIKDYFNFILNALKKGILVTAKKDGIVNPMTISWGQIGIEWNKLIFTIFVRKSRYTHGLLESGEFTINIPVDKYPSKILEFCGTKSGRDFDKVKELNLTLVESKKVSVPGIKELPFTLECKILYKQDQDKKAIPDYIKKQLYPEGIPDKEVLNNSYHTVFFGEIVSAYIIE